VVGHYSSLSEPNGHKPIAFEDTGYVYPHRCWTCMVPCLIREDIVMDEVDGQVRTLPRALLDRQGGVPGHL